MECFEKGILSSSQTEGFEMQFGDGEAALEAIKMISYREGFGDIMAEGVQRTAEHIGNDSERFAMHVKGMEFPGYEPRGAFGSGLAYAVSPRGACHRRAWPPAQEILGSYPPYTAEGKGEMVKELYDLNCVLHGLLVCDMQSKFIPMSLDVYSEYFHGVTGERLTTDDFQTIADRIENLVRMYNVREGFSREDDTLPYRTLHEPLPDGPGTGQCIGEENLNKMLDEYYQVRGWDNAGVPTEETVKKYDL